MYALVAFRRKPVTFLKQEVQDIWLGNIEFAFQTGLYFLKEEKNVFLRASFPDSLLLQDPPTHCALYNQSKQLCAIWGMKVKLEVQYDIEEHVHCYSMTWSQILEEFNPQTCFSMAEFNWYGGSLMYNQTWPLNKAEVHSQLYRTHDLKSYHGEVNKVGNILDLFWISSAGIAVILENTLSIDIRLNQDKDHLLCFQSKSLDRQVLKYKVCKAKNMREIHRFILNKYIHLPLNLPKDSIFKKPIWSTYPMFKNTLNQEKLLVFVKQIIENDFDHGVIDVQDDGLSVFRRTLLDKEKYPNAHQAVMLIRGDYRFEPVFPISPFVSVLENVDKSKLVQDNNGVPVVRKFEGLDVNIINLKVNDVFEWFVEQVKDAKAQYGFEGFRLMGCESDIIDPLEDIFARNNAGETFAVQLLSIAEILKLQTISTFASHSQKYAGIIQLTSHQSTWDSNGGLKSVIPSVLTLGILGYPFVIANVVGGPGTMKDNATESEVLKPDRELYIRWMSLAAYMPCLMFSFPPWLYDKEVVSITKKLINMRSEFVAPLIIKAAREYEISGSPIIRPLWWTDSSNVIAQEIDDQFLIGDTMMVAPIVQQGQMKRNIYIPLGKWRDVINDNVVEGKMWLKEYPVSLDQTPTFILVKS